MKERTHTPQARKSRWRVRFSLRTAVVLILVYAGLWTITALYGQIGLYVADPNEKVENIFLDHPPPRNRMPEGVFPVREAVYFYAEVTAFAPFLCRADIEDGSVYREDDLEFYYPQYAKVRMRVWYFWLFGATYRISERPVPRSQPLDL